MEYRAMKSFNYVRAKSAILSMCNIPVIVVRFLSLQNINVGLSVWLSIQADIVQFVQNIRCYAYVLILEDMSNKFELKLSYRNFRSTNLSFISRVITPAMSHTDNLEKKCSKSWTVDFNIVNTLNQSYHIQLTVLVYVYRSICSCHKSILVSTKKRNHKLTRNDS